MSWKASSKRWGEDKEWKKVHWRMLFRLQKIVFYQPRMNALNWSFIHCFLTVPLHWHALHLTANRWRFAMIVVSAVTLEAVSKILANSQIQDVWCRVDLVVGCCFVIMSGLRQTLTWPLESQRHLTDFVSRYSTNLSLDFIFQRSSQHLLKARHDLDTITNILLNAISYSLETVIG